MHKTKVKKELSFFFVYDGGVQIVSIFLTEKMSRYVTDTFTFVHSTDYFIQSDVQRIQSKHLSVISHVMFSRTADLKA